MEARLGMLPTPEEQLTVPFAVQFDQRESLREPVHFGWIGEDSAGIWLRLHPDVVLAQDPELWRIVSEFQLCSDRQVNADSVSLRSHWWLVMWNAMLAASQRDEARRLRARHGHG